MFRWSFARRRDAAAERIDPQSAYELWAASYEPSPHNRLMELEQATARYDYQTRTAVLKFQVGALK